MGDKIRSVNGIDVRNASHEKVVSFLKSTSDIYLVVERAASTQFPVQSLLSHAQSLPSLVTIGQQELEPLSAPPLPPKRASSRTALDSMEFPKFDFKSMMKDLVIKY